MTALPPDAQPPIPAKAATVLMAVQSLVETVHTVKTGVGANKRTFTAPSPAGEITAIVTVLAEKPVYAGLQSGERLIPAGTLKVGDVAPLTP